MVKESQGISLDYNWKGFIPMIIVLAIGSILVFMARMYTGEMYFRVLFFGFMFLFVGFITLFALSLTLLSKMYAVKTLNAKIEEEIRKSMEKELEKREEEERKEDVLDEIF
ncbi:MAG: hypothetical protein ACP6IP_04400 [Candidatus Njordarchaeia archaeon]